LDDQRAAAEVDVLRSKSERLAEPKAAPPKDCEESGIPDPRRSTP
jgi:hypothetical protein